MRKTGFICDEQIFWHDNGSAMLSVPSGGLYQPGKHVESPEPKRRLKSLVAVSGLGKELYSLPSRMATREDVERFHTTQYVDDLIAASDAKSSGPFGELCIVGPGSYDIARRSAGGVISGLCAVMNGDADNAYCVTRPSGHHAEPNLARGFCLIGNIPVAVHYGKEKLGINRVAVIDWDVHHGNGTEVGFYDRDDVLTVSIHEAFNFPFDTGAEADIGKGAGEGCNVNIPLPPGSGVGAYDAAFARVIEPKVRAFKPDVIFVACGFDASFFDPMGHQLLPATYFGVMARKVMSLADELCGGKLVVVHEGGYSDGMFHCAGCRF